MATSTPKSGRVAEPGFVGRFHQEARLIANLRHPNIVQVYDFGQQDSSIYMVQELLVGPTLEAWIGDLAARGAYEQVVTARVDPERRHRAVRLDRQRLHRHLATRLADEREGGVILVEGPPGIGKTSLIAAGLASAPPAVRHRKPSGL